MYLRIHVGRGMLLPRAHGAHLPNAEGSIVLVWSARQYFRKFIHTSNISNEQWSDKWARMEVGLVVFLTLWQLNTGSHFGDKWGHVHTHTAVTHSSQVPAELVILSCGFLNACLQALALSVFEMLKWKPPPVSPPMLTCWFSLVSFPVF